VMNILALAIFISLNVGLTSKSAQAFGAKNYRLIGLYLHRGLIVNLTLFLPFCGFLFFSDRICMACGFEEKIARYIQQYLIEAIPGLFATILFSTFTAYLNACNIFTIPGMLEIIGCVVNWVSNYILIEKYQMGLRGAAMAWNLMFFVALILTVIYLKFWNPVKQTLFWFCRDSFKEVWSLFKHEALIGSMIYLEWIAVEIEVVYVGGLDQIQLTAFPLAFAHINLVYSIPVSLSEAVLTYVGNAVGEKNVEKGKKFLKSGVVLACSAVVLIVIYFWFCSKYIAEFYVDDQATRDMMVKYFGLMAIQVPADFIQFVLASGLRALGKEKAGTILLIICYYGISLPLAYIFCYPAGYGGRGIIFGSSINAYILLICLIIMYKKIDWEKQIRIVNDKMKEDDTNENEKLDESEGKTEDKP